MHISSEDHEERFGKVYCFPGWVVGAIACRWLNPLLPKAVWLPASCVVPHILRTCPPHTHTQTHRVSHGYTHRVGVFQFCLSGPPTDLLSPQGDRAVNQERYALSLSLSSLSLSHSLSLWLSLSPPLSLPLSLSIFLRLCVFSLPQGDRAANQAR